ncbi:prephenate dehydrogenase [Prescottella equi]|uniref:prephenate dehydrogenase n=1 Tax=Rhodococcus hoagii TaxID=43767 RepID=UPI0009C08806|nr:prephenate dehydrogenase [Prescottella equi]OQQ35412.1 prephenate dehydrogenase [Prescottella equi]WQB72722.1 prephenate dehydrogenase [Prescottella equi]
MCQPDVVSDAVSAPPVCILGLGLIGGSLLRAAVAAGRDGWGWNRSAPTVGAARADGFDADTDLTAVLRRARAARALIVVAVPMPAVDATLAAIAEHAPDCPVTDVVSVKAEVAAAVARHGLQDRFVGGHPMAGTSESGWEAGDAELFRDAVWVVSADDGVDPQVWSQVVRLALDCGSVVVPAESVEHDAAAARISHLPHVLAEALALSGAAGGDLALGLAAGSFRDGTRVAGSAPALVRAMCEGNRDALLTALDETLDVLTRARAELADHGTLAGLVEPGFEARRRYEDRERWTITGIDPGSENWRERLRDAGRRGGVLRP